MTVQRVRPIGFDANLSPFAFQHYAKDFYAAYTNHKHGPTFSPARFFLLARSIELAAKALHVAQGCEPRALFQMDHDLEAACEPAVLSAYSVSLSAAEQEELRKANRYYEGKGFEYFWFDLPGVPIARAGAQQALSGWPDLPEEALLESLLQKLLTPRL